MDVMSEGAEGEDDALDLYDLGCEFASGLLFGQPMTAQEAGTLLFREEEAMIA